MSEEDPDYHPDTEDSIDGEETDSGSEGETEEVVEAVSEFDQAETEALTETLPEAELAVPEAEAAVPEVEGMPEAITEGVPPALIDLMKANRDETRQSIDTQL